MQFFAWSWNDSLTNGLHRASRMWSFSLHQLYTLSTVQPSQGGEQPSRPFLAEFLASQVVSSQMKLLSLPALQLCKSRTTFWPRWNWQGQKLRDTFWSSMCLNNFAGQYFARPTSRSTPTCDLANLVPFGDGNAKGRRREGHGSSQGFCLGTLLRLTDWHG